jgi:hypothetical protein
LAVNVTIGVSGPNTGSLTVFGTATNAIQCPNGFFTGRGLIATEAAYNAIQVLGPGGINTHGATVRRYINLVGVNSITPLPGDSFLSGLSSQIWYYQLGSRTRISGAFGLIVDGSGSSVVEGITLSTGYINSAHGFQSPHTAFNTFQALSGGAYFAQCVTKTQGFIVENSVGTWVARIHGFGSGNSGFIQLLNSSGQLLFAVDRHFSSNFGVMAVYQSFVPEVVIQASASFNIADSITVKNQSGSDRIRMGVFGSGQQASITLTGQVNTVHIDTSIPQVLINGNRIITTRKSDPGAAAGWADATAQAWANSLRTQLAAATGGHGLF